MGEDVRRWIPLALTLLGITLYSAISLWLKVDPGELALDPSLKPTGSIIGEQAALFHFRSAAVLAIVSAMAGTIITAFIIVRHAEPRDLPFHLATLAAVVALAVLINILSRGLTCQLVQTGCPHPHAMTGEAFRFCASRTVIAPACDEHLPGTLAASLRQAFGSGLPVPNLRQVINLPLAAAAACIGYTTFLLAAGGRSARAAATRERIIAFVMAIGGVMLACVVLLDREYARWAFAGLEEAHPAKIPTKNEGIEAYVDGVTFFAGATSSTLLLMIWLFAAGLLIWTSGDGARGRAGRLFSRRSSFYAIAAVVAPTVLAIAQTLFKK